MKIQLYILAMGLLMIAAGQAGDRQPDLSDPVIKGSGRPFTRKWFFEKDRHFSGIKAHGIGSLEIIMGDTDQITVTTDDNIGSRQV